MFAPDVIIQIISTSDCIIIEDKNGAQGKGYPNPDQTFQAEFNELLFISIALKLNQNFMDSLMIRSPGSNATSPLILQKIHEGQEVRLGLNFRGGELKFPRIGSGLGCVIL